MIHEVRYPLAISALGILFLHNCNLMAVMHSMCVEAQDTWHCQLGEEEVTLMWGRPWSLHSRQHYVKETFDAPYIEHQNSQIKKLHKMSSLRHWIVRCHISYPVCQCLPSSNGWIKPAGHTTKRIKWLAQSFEPWSKNAYWKTVHTYIAICSMTNW